MPMVGIKVRPVFRKTVQWSEGLVCKPLVIKAEFFRRARFCLVLSRFSGRRDRTFNVRPSIESALTLALSPRRGKAHFPTLNKSSRKTVQRLESIIRNSLAINVDFFLRQIGRAH